MFRTDARLCPLAIAMAPSEAPAFAASRMRATQLGGKLAAGFFLRRRSSVADASRAKASSAATLTAGAVPSLPKVKDQSGDAGRS
jgi:hypothetical protein